MKNGLTTLHLFGPVKNRQVATRVPTGVICLISALAFHELTTQIPHAVHLALPRGAEEPRLTHPPIKTYRFTGEAFS